MSTATGRIGRSWLWGLMVGASLCVASCSRVPAGVVPVSGRITLGGKPLAGATVTFQPTPQTTTPAVGGSAGRTDAEGRYILRLIEPDVAGAAVGRHTVTITTATASGRDDVLPSGERVPAGWRNGSQTFEVPAGGTTAANFDLP